MSSHRPPPRRPSAGAPPARERPRAPYGTPGREDSAPRPRTRPPTAPGPSGDRGEWDRDPRRKPSVISTLLAGRSRAQKEQDREQDAKIAVLVIVACGVLGWVVYGAATAVGLAVGLWSVDALVPTALWGLASAVWRRPLRPLAVTELRWGVRVGMAIAALIALWLAWPLWAGPAAAAWGPGLEWMPEPGVSHAPFVPALMAAQGWYAVVSALLLVAVAILVPGGRREPAHREPAQEPERELERITPDVL